MHAPHPALRATLSRREKVRNGEFLVYRSGMTDFEDRVRRMAREAMKEIGRRPDEIADVIEPPGADYCVITFTDPAHKPIEIPRPMGAGDSQELDEIRRAVLYRFGT